MERPDPSVPRLRYQHGKQPFNFRRILQHAEQGCLDELLLGLNSSQAIRLDLTHGVVNPDSQFHIAVQVASQGTFPW